MKCIKIINIVTIIFIAFLISFNPVKAQDKTNLLLMHTGKSYILDFPIKVTRVVGGDPSAIELNLFKKKELEGELPGCQLLIAPISEKNTNIIIWTEVGLYVFDVVIDNSSPRTVETIINVPKGNKKFNIPLVESSQNVTKTVKPVEADQQEIDLSDDTISNDVEYQVKGPDNNDENFDEPDSIQENKNNNIKNNKEKTVDTLIIDQPPELNENTPVETVQKKQPKPKVEKKVEKASPKKVQAKKPVEKQKKREEVIIIDLKPQASKKIDIESSLSEKPEERFVGKINNSSEGLKLTVGAVNIVNNSFVINLTLKNSSNQVKYLLWDLTKVTDSTATNFLVRNKSLPPGIIDPEKELKGSIVALPKSKNINLRRIKALHLSILNTEGEVIINTDIPLHQ